MIKLCDEAVAIQSRLPTNSGKRYIAETSRRFRELMQKGNVNGAIKLLTNNMKGGILPLNNDKNGTSTDKAPGRERCQR